LARRTRRNISDKRIRKIIKEQLDQSGDTPPGTPASRTSGTLRTILFAAGVVVVLAVIMFWARSTDLARFRKDSGSSPAQQEAQTTVHRTDTPKNTPEQATKPQKPPEPAPEDLIRPVTGKPQVEVLNGCGANGIALTTTRYLRKKGFDVVSRGNYKHFKVEKSFIISRTGNMEIARKLAQVMGIPREQTRKEVDPTKQLEASVILGKDYKKLKPFLKK